MTEHARILNHDLYQGLVEPVDEGVQAPGTTGGTLYTCRNYLGVPHEDADGPEDSASSKTGGICSQWEKPHGLDLGDWSFGYFCYRVELVTHENMIW